jgi:hypothetical protein
VYPGKPRRDAIECHRESLPSRSTTWPMRRQLRPAQPGASMHNPCSRAEARRPCGRGQLPRITDALTSRGPPPPPPRTATGPHRDGGGRARPDQALVAAGRVPPGPQPRRLDPGSVAAGRRAGRYNFSG